MKEELIIDYTNDLSFKFHIGDGITVQKVIVDIFGEKKAFETIINNGYHTFTLPNSVFEEGKTGRISFYFSFIDEDGNYKLTNFAKFKKFKIIKGSTKKIANNYIVPHQTSKRNFILIVTPDLRDVKLTIDNDLASINYQKETITLQGQIMTYLLPLKRIELMLEGREFSKFKFNVNYNINFNCN
jgi:hypothetical protein